MSVDSLFRFDQVLRSRELGGRHFDWVHWDLLKRNADLYGDREAFVDTFYGVEPGRLRRRTWQQAYRDVNAMIFHLLDRAVPRGSVMVSHLPNSIESAYLDIVTSKLRMKHAGLNVDLGKSETVGVIKKLGPTVAVIVSEWHGREFAEWYLEAKQAVPNMRILVLPKDGEEVPAGCESLLDYFDPAIFTRYPENALGYLKTDPLEVHELLPTGGTTGVPKISQRTPMDWFHVHSVAIAERAGHGLYDTRLLIGPLSGGSGRLWGVHTPLYTGGRSIYLTEFDEKTVLQLTREEAVTIWVWNPALITRVVTHEAFNAETIRTLRLVSYSGAPMSGEVIEKLLRHGVPSFNVYGTSEVGGCMGPILSGISRDHLVQAAGVPYEGFDVPVIDNEGRRLGPGEVGEILIWNIHHGYWNSPEESRATYHEEGDGGPWEGYQHTGDLGVYDQDGYLRVVGRKKDMVLRGSQNIFPKEIEDHLSPHPKVRDIAVVGMPDPVLGERVCAFVVPQPGEHPTVEDFAAFLAARDVAKFKWPERVEVLDAMPLGPGGKIQKMKLREMIQEKLAAES
ncbi:class I adenylate-forming enzyme family protein [Sulfobacillus harzensis]|uniref:Acyl--CoA ligase n=1 Tax=Sulfobacillus harzensis TaxID=2729629 RepID=A0A7Y0Q4V5_9FIRM|nr:class I adenylate-forming enzyme family protein [Sulfobacillus harzensis]NMP23614.1 acyl--CoA ligase [Sulfobacillus harzensis]